MLISPRYKETGTVAIVANTLSLYVELHSPANDCPFASVKVTDGTVDSNFGSRQITIVYVSPWRAVGLYPSWMFKRVTVRLFPDLFYNFKIRFARVGRDVGCLKGTALHG